MLKTQRCRPVRALVVSTDLIIYDTWPGEIEEYPKFKHLECVYLHGPYLQDSMHAVKLGVFDIAFTTPDTLTMLIDEYPKLFKHFKLFIVDESTKYKGWKSNRFKKARKMLKSCPWIEQRVCMTGTPAPNGWMQLFTQFWLVGGTKVFNTDSFYEFQERFFYKHARKKYQWLMLPDADVHISKRIAPYIFQPNSDEYKELPDIVEYEYHIELPERVIRLHRQMKRQKAITVQGKPVLAANAGVSTFKCAQIASGAVYRYTDPLNPAGGRETIHLHNCKTDALEDLLEDVGDANCLVIYSYEHDLARIKKRLPHARDISKDKGALKAWKAGKLELMTGHPASMAHGLNLQAGGNVIIFYSTTPDAEYWEQVIKRLHRGNISEPVYVYYLIGKDTEDERFMSLVRQKVLDQEELMLRFSGLQ